MLHWSHIPPEDLERAEYYRLKAQDYRASASVETDRSRCEAFEVLAANFEWLAAAYDRIASQDFDAPSPAQAGLRAMMMCWRRFFSEGRRSIRETV